LDGDFIITKRPAALFAEGRTGGKGKITFCATLHRLGLERLKSLANKVHDDVFDAVLTFD